MRYEVIASLKKEYSITRLCQALQVSPSGYYAWKKRPKSQRRQEDEQLSQHIYHAYQQSRQTYGSPRIHAHLQKTGMRCGRKRVIRLMQEQHLSAQRTHHRCQTTDSRHENPIAPNVLQRDFSADHPNEKWVADITGVWTSQGWLYVAIVLDVFSRMVVGWSMDVVRDDDLVLRALQMALSQRHPDGSLLHHSDRGSQYTSHDYQSLLKSKGMTISMSRKGNCYDNAMMESFNATLKGECTERQSWSTVTQARQAIFEFIECWYNRQRLHSSLGYFSPMAFEDTFLTSFQV